MQESVPDRRHVECIGSIEVWRIISALAVIWIHSASSDFGSAMTIVCRFAVPFFASCTAFFSTRSALSPHAPTFVFFAKSRFKRIYVPFLSWTVVYLLFRLLKHIFHPGGSPIIIGPSTLLTGTAHHLWFLPFALIVSSLGFALGLFAKGRGTIARIGLAMVLGILGVVSSFAPAVVPVDLENSHSSYFLHFALDASPAAFWAVSIAVLPSNRTSKRSALVFIVLSFVFLSTMIFAGYHPLLAGLSGFFIFLSALTGPPLRLSNTAALAASLSFGVYSFHVLAVEGAQFGLAHFDISDSLALDLGVFGFSACASYVLCYGANHFKTLRQFVR